jgi:myo-inositol-1(or 4)-monophosphatase
MPGLAARLAVAQPLIREAGALAQTWFADLTSLGTTEKENGQDVVSVADKTVEALIRTRLQATFPDDGFLGEESGFEAGTSGYCWVVDPIDGTSCFVFGRPDWCVSIALMHGQETVFGLIFAPQANELFEAVRGGGARLNGQPIAVNRQASLKTALMGVGANFRVPVAEAWRFVAELLEAGGMFIRSGSGALMLAEVACGRLAGYYEPHINAWDCLAGLCLVREAGGWTAPFGEGAGGLMAGGPVIAAAPQVRGELMALIRKAAAPA